VEGSWGYQKLHTVREIAKDRLRAVPVALISTILSWLFTVSVGAEEYLGIMLSLIWAHLVAEKGKRSLSSFYVNVQTVFGYFQSFPLWDFWFLRILKFTQMGSILTFHSVPIFHVISFLI
jgi:hypothetical protein